MKRTLSLVLALVMVLGSFTTVFAAVEVDTAADFLADEGILRGADGDLMLDNNLERRDAVILLSRLLDAEEIAEDFEATEENPTWEDVRTDAYYVPFFAWAEENGYFEGDDEGNFNPRNAITAPEYSLVLLRALGYEVNGHESWKASLETAEKIGLLEGVEVEFADLVVRGEMAVMTYNALNAKMNGTDETLAEFLGIEMPEEEKATELEVVQVYTENLAEVVVELSNIDLVANKEALTTPSNYRISNETKVYNVDLDGDNVILTLVPYGRIDEIAKAGKYSTELIKGKEYDLTIRNIDKAINKTYEDFVAVDNEIPYIESVEFIGTHGIKVTTSEPINNPQERNFRVNDKRTSMFIEQYGRELILTPYHNVSFDKDATELVVEGLVDFANYRSVKTHEDMELVTDTTAPEVVEAYRSGDKLTLIFDQDIYHSSVKHNESRRELGNVSFEERRVTFYAEDANKVDTNKVVYTLEREIPKNAEITVEGVQNHSKEAMEKDVVVPVLFNDEYAPVVISDLSLSIRTTGNEKRGDKLESATKGLTVTFDKDIVEFKDLTAEELEERAVEFFSLYSLDVARRNDITDKVEIKVVEVKADRIKLDFVNKATNEELHINNSYRDYDYVLEVKNFRDIAGNRMVREYIDFQILVKATAFDVTLKEPVQVRESNRDDVEIELAFTAAVDKASAEDATNYYLDGKLDVDEAIVERDGKTVTLVLHDTLLKDFDYETLEISPRVRNLAKKVTVANRFWDFETLQPVEEDVDEEPVVVEALEDKIAEVEALVEANYTAETWEVLQTALTAAKEVIANEEATQEEVDAALKDLEAARAALAPAEEEPVVPGEDEVTGDLVSLPGIGTVLEVEGAAGVTKVTVNGEELAESAYNYEEAYDVLSIPNVEEGDEVVLTIDGSDFIVIF